MMVVAMALVEANHWNGTLFRMDDDGGGDLQNFAAYCNCYQCKIILKICKKIVQYRMTDVLLQIKTAGKRMQPSVTSRRSLQFKPTK